MAYGQYHDAAQQQLRIKDSALQITRWRNARSITDKAARYPGFRQGTRLFKKGTQVKPGHLPLPIDIILHESVPMTLSDGTTIFCDIFLPARFENLQSSASGKVPTLVAWSPYGKQQGTTLLDDFPLRAGVPAGWVSGLQKWEGPDPAFWCSYNYAIVNVDTRGAYSSEGDLRFFGYQEAQDGAEFITWLSEQAWSNGRVGLTGNSWLAIAQWKIGSLRPKGLEALAPFEGFGDFYRHNICEGGIPFVGFHDTIADTFASQGRLEDPSALLRDSDEWSDYWEDKTAHPEWITTPIYVTASWTNPAHTLGTFKSWSALPDSTHKWLRVHNKQEWSDYYHDTTVKDLKRFFDFYLHGRTDNGWDATPRVRLSVLHLGLNGIDDTVSRAETEFPLARTRYTRHYLSGEGGLSLDVPGKATVSYSSTTGKTVFRYRIPKACETTGYFMAHLVMSSEAPEMDVFVQVEKFSAQDNRQGTMVIRPQNPVLERILKFLHDRQLGLSKVGLLFNWGPSGQLRAGFSGTYDEARSSTAEPFYTYRRKTPLSKGETRSLDIQLRPYGVYWEENDILQFTVSGKAIVPFPIPGLEMHQTQNSGLHNIHCGAHDEDSSYILLPFV